ncbi:MAG: hypothetical protein HYU51_10780 [Candidatus Rokubacteria bacterium]|nr:hypothetical protein [Candidatus Rokubacteria bacterium]
MKLDGGEMVLRLLVTVDPARRFDAETELRRRIKDALDRERLASWRSSDEKEPS